MGECGIRRVHHVLAVVGHPTLRRRHPTSDNNSGPWLSRISQASLKQKGPRAQTFRNSVVDNLFDNGDC